MVQMYYWGRDEYIGGIKVRLRKKRLNNIGIISTIVPVQPFGYNMLLGKLLDPFVVLRKSEKIGRIDMVTNLLV